MGGIGKPNAAIVSVWHWTENRQKLLGSGAFVTPRHVLTAAHVVDRKNPPSSEVPAGAFRLKLVDGFDQPVTIPDAGIECHPDLDLALIRLDIVYPEQGLVPLDCVTASRGKVDLHYVNPQTKNRYTCSDYTLGDYDQNEGAYVCDHQVQHGASGGIAELNGRAVGVIVARHGSEQQSIILPLQRAAEWIEEILARDGLATSHLFRPPQAAAPKPAPGGSFDPTVRGEIETLLARRRLRPLREALGDLDRLVPLARPFSIETAIDHLHAAAKGCLQRLADEASGETAEIARGAVEVLGWLVLLAVSEDWLQQQDGDPDRLVRATSVQIPLRTDAGTAVVVARLRNHPAKVALDEQGVCVTGADQVPVDIETGMAAADGLVELKRLIWKTVFKADPPPAITEADEKRLKARLKLRFGRGQTYYIAVPVDSSMAPMQSLNLFERLHDEFPYLAVLMIGTEGGAPILVLEEEDLEARIGDLLLMLRGYE